MQNPDIHIKNLSTAPFQLEHPGCDQLSGRLSARRSTLEKRLLRVMVVEDSDCVRAVWRHMIATIGGLSIGDECATLSAALTCLQGSAPDVVLLDIQLQGESGMAVLENLRKRHAPTVVIVVSNYADDVCRQHYMAAGAQAFFDKSHELKGLRKFLACLVVGQSGIKSGYEYQCQ